MAKIEIKIGTDINDRPIMLSTPGIYATNSMVAATNIDKIIKNLLGLDLNIGSIVRSEKITAISLKLDSINQAL